MGERAVAVARATIGSARPKCLRARKRKRKAHESVASELGGGQKVLFNWRARDRAPGSGAAKHWIGPGRAGECAAQVFALRLVGALIGLAGVSAALAAGHHHHQQQLAPGAFGQARPARAPTAPTTSASQPACLDPAGLGHRHHQRQPAAPFARLTKRSAASQTSAAGKAADSTRVVAVSGQWIELQCPLANELLAVANSGAPSARPDHTIIWHKDGVRLNQMNPRLRIDPLNASLVIVQAQARLDEGAYECSLVNVARETAPLKAHRFELRLLVAPRLAAFEFAADAQVGMKILLTCSALEGQQPISFVWLKDNQIIQEPGVGQQQAVPGAPVQQRHKQLASSLSQLHQQQLADKLTLAAHPGGLGQLGAAQKSEHVVVSGQPLAADQALEPALDAPQAGPKTGVLSVLSDSSIRIRQSDDYSILSIEPLELKHSGRYTCTAQNEAARVSHSSQLAINAPPTLTVEPKDGDLVSGQSTVVECAAAGQPRPTISWLRARESSGKQWDFVPIYDNLRYTILSNGSLAISNATQREQGFYMCSAKNGFGPEMTKLIKITVHEPARLGIKYKTVEARIDERALMTCSATGEPPIALEWFDKEGKPIHKSDKHFIIDDGDSMSLDQNAIKNNSTESRLIIARAGRLDSGHYTCQATNKYGTDKMVTNLLVQDVPDKVSDLKVTNVTSTTISLRWQLAFTGNSPVSSYLVQYQSDDPLDDLLMSVARSASTSPDSGGSSGGGQLGAATETSQPGSAESRLLPLISNSRDLDQQQQPNQQQLNSNTNPTASLKAALDALNIASNYESSASADEVIDRTLVELTVEQSSTSLVVKDLSPFCVYRLRLAGINKIGLGEFSDWIRAKTEEAPPSGSALKISAAATGPNSIKLTWLPPDRRTWNGQLMRFNIGYRPIDSAFEFNKSVEWSPPTLQSIMLDVDKKRIAPPVLPLKQAPQTDSRGGQTSGPNGAKPPGAATKNLTASDPQQKDGSPHVLRQHLRQLLALQQQELVAHLTNLQRSTTYLVWIQAANSRGLGPQSHAITVKTLDDVPPSAPALRVQSTTPSSITIAWSMLSNFVSSANQYSLFYRRVPPPPPQASAAPGTATSQQGAGNEPPLANSSQMLADSVTPLMVFHEPGPFIERTITSQQLMLSGNMMLSSSADQEQIIIQELGKQSQGSFMHQQAQHYQQFVYTLDQLDCGSVYELYMTTRNSVGKSEPSPVVTTRTLGEPPLAPSNKNSFFARIGSQDVLLNLASWSTGGCPMTHITVRCKQLPAPSAAASSSAPTGLALSSSLIQNSSTSSSSSTTTGWPISTSVPQNLLASINNQLNGRSYTSTGNSPARLLGGDMIGDSGAAQFDSLVAPFALKNLHPSTGYELEIIAYNAAGHTTAQYEFVTAGPNGSRSGYTRREGFYRIDQRGQPLDATGSSGAAGPLGEQQAPFTDQTGVSGQLVPLALTALCFVCLIISSTFCYYRLASTWKGQRRHSADGASARDRCARGGLSTANLSPSSTIGAKSALNWARVNVGAHSSTMKHSNRHRLPGHGQLDDQDPDSPPTGAQMHYCIRDPTANHLLSATLNPKSSNFSQSVSMKDFNLIAPIGAASTLNFKNYRGSLRPSTGNIPKDNTLRGRLYGGNDVSNENLANPSQAAYGNIGNPNHRQPFGQALNLDQVCSATAGAYGTGCKQNGLSAANQLRASNQTGAYGATTSGGSPLYDGQHGCYSAEQHETSWTTAATTASGANCPVSTSSQQQNGTNYAIPSASYQTTNEHQMAYDGGQLIYSQDTYGQSSIDACIRHLMSQHQYQQQEQQSGQQYAMLVGQQKHDQQASRCVYANESLEFSNATANQLNGGGQNLNCALQSAVGKADCNSTTNCSIGTHSVIDSSSSSSGIGVSGAHHLDCSASTATGNSSTNIQSTNNQYQLNGIANYGCDTQPKQTAENFANSSKDQFRQSQQQQSIEFKQI